MDGQTDDVTWQYYLYVAQKSVVAYKLAVYYFNFDKSHKCEKVIHRTLKLQSTIIRIKISTMKKYIEIVSVLNLNNGTASA